MYSFLRTIFHGPTSAGFRVTTSWLRPLNRRSCSVWRGLPTTSRGDPRGRRSGRSAKEFHSPPGLGLTPERRRGAGPNCYRTLTPVTRAPVPVLLTTKSSSPQTPSLLLSFRASARHRREGPRTGGKGRPPVVPVILGGRRTRHRRLGVRSARSGRRPVAPPLAACVAPGSKGSVSETRRRGCR